MNLLKHVPLFLILLVMVIIERSNWEWKWPETAAPEPACRQIVLPPLQAKDPDYLVKAVQPHTLRVPFMDFEIESDMWTVTGYAIGDGLTPGEHTFDGRKVRPGITMACPKELPMGTVVIIEGLGPRVCEDRGGAIIGKRLDVAFESPMQALVWGVQERKIAIIWP